MFLRKDPIISLLYGSLVRLPTPLNISFFWNFGSLVGFFMSLQIVTGFFLSMHYCSSIYFSFDSISHINSDVNYGWMMRYMHINGASFFMMMIYCHIARGLYYKRYSKKNPWFCGVLMLFFSMMIAFLGYVLPWGQMSFWGATVITNMVSAIPLVGKKMTFWLWGGYSVGQPTLFRFFSFHFFFPFLLVFLSFFHIYFIHSSGGSGTPLGFFSSMKVSFWPFFGFKDLMGAAGIFFFFFSFFFFTDLFTEPDNYMKANSMVTPQHIKPEWYFLFAYAILRCIPNKLLGVISLFLSIFVFFFLPFSQSVFQKSFYHQTLFWFWAFNFFFLTWLGGLPVKTFFIFFSQIFSFFYFFFFFIF
uniref:Cytochrome b n=1 Tax=Aplidium tabarquensis TaxID=1256662 RepID=A0A024GWT5_9ASCI|nr:cytochrome b [Aplidium tabarquensis]